MGQFIASAAVPFGLFLLLCLEKGTILAIKKYGSKRAAYWWTTDVRLIAREKYREWRNFRQGQVSRKH